MQLLALDRLAIAVSTGLFILIIGVIGYGDQTAPVVRDFSWHQQQVRAADRAFIMTFSRPMNRLSVEQNLKITPQLDGKFSWSGRRMAYTLNQPIPYGTTYTLQLTGAVDAFVSEFGDSSAIRPFRSEFSSPPLGFIYINPSGQLVLHGDRPEQVLTPKTMKVLDFKIYADRSRVLFGAIPATSSNPLDQQLYSVPINNPAKLELELDAQEYQNLKFDLAANGEVIVVQRLSRRQLGQYGLWLIRAGEKPFPLDNQPGGDFLIAPDSESVAIAQGEGVAILPLKAGAKPVDFLPRFGMVLGFSHDGAQAVMVKFNQNYTRSLFRVDNQGRQEELLTTTGSILHAQFDQFGQNIYGIFTDVSQTATTYQESAYVAAINLATKQLKRLYNLPAGQRETKLSLAPDQAGLLLERTLPQKQIVFIALGDRQLGTNLPLGSNPQWLPWYTKQQLTQDLNLWFPANILLQVAKLF